MDLKQDLKAILDDEDDSATASLFASLATEARLANLTLLLLDKDVISPADAMQLQAEQKETQTILFDYAIAMASVLSGIKPDKLSSMSKTGFRQATSIEDAFERYTARVGRVCPIPKEVLEALRAFNQAPDGGPERDPA